MRNFRELEIWQRSFELVDEVYTQSENFPKDERFGLTSQMRRASVSIPSNIAEGCSRRTKKDFARFLEIAIGSAFELETQLLIAVKRTMIDKVKGQAMIDELNQIQKMINAFRISLGRC